MRIDTLLSPGILSNGFSLRRESAKAISSIQITAGNTPGGKTRAAAVLAAFFTDCASKLSALTDDTAPTVVSRVRTGANTATITMSEALDTTVTPALSSVVFTPTRTVTAISIVGSTMVITATGVIATDTIDYTQPAINGVRDLAGNQAATFTGVLA